MHSALLKGRKEMDDISHEETVRFTSSPPAAIARPYQMLKTDTPAGGERARFLVSLSNYNTILHPNPCRKQCVSKSYHNSDDVRMNLRRG